jgi:tRNA(Ile)-lysidine synthase
MSNRPLKFTALHLLDILRSYQDVNNYVVGFSGGTDSTALLHALCTVRDQLTTPFSAVHVNHGLHEDAGAWQLQCENFCREHNVKLTCLTVQPDSRSGKGLEAEARHLRYEAISALLNQGTCLLTAHHADDQAETLLLNLMRGSGVDGLSSMPESRSLGKGLLKRPLLEFQSNTLKQYLRDNNIDWIEDPSNQYLNHDRNLVRHEIIPLLEKRWPGVSKRLLLTRKAMTDARFLLEKVADEFLGKHLLHPFVLQITSSTCKDPEMFKLVVRRWMKQSGVPSIPAYRLESLCQQVQNTDHDQKVKISWGGWTLRLYKHQLWLHADAVISPCPTVKWPQSGNAIDLGGDVGQLIIKGQNPATPAGKLIVASRANIEGTGIRQGSHHKSLKNLFQSAEIPPWLRDCVPLCKLEGELVAVGDWCYDEHFESWMSEHHLELSWQPRNPLLQFIVTQQHPQVVDPAGAVG